MGMSIPHRKQGIVSAALSCSLSGSLAVTMPSLQGEIASSQWLLENSEHQIMNSLPAK
jgi:hypothetical protein